MPRRIPNRNGDEISVRFNDGWAEVFRVEDEAPPGYQPQPVLKQEMRLPFQNRTVGVNRYYNAKQNQIEIELVIRVPKPDKTITNKNVVKVADKTFRIDFVQEIKDVFPESLDLTLVKYEQKGRRHEVV